MGRQKMQGVRVTMLLKGCRSIAHIYTWKDESVLLPQYTEQLIGLLYVCSGSGTLAGVSQRPLCLDGRSAAVYPAWRPHRLTSGPDSSLFICAFACEHNEVVSAKPADIRQLQAQFDALAQAMDRGLETAPDKAFLMQPLEIMVKEPSDIPAYVQSARSMIDSCYSEGLTLEELARRVHRSKYHLCRAFREHYHVTPGAYLTSVRLARAKDLLTQTGLSVKEIGRQVGYSSSSYFTSQFRQRFGCSPNAYRALQRDLGKG